MKPCNKLAARLGAKCPSHSRALSISYRTLRLKLNRDESIKRWLRRRDSPNRAWIRAKLNLSARKMTWHGQKSNCLKWPASEMIVFPSSSESRHWNILQTRSGRREVTMVVCWTARAAVRTRGRISQTLTVVSVSSILIERLSPPLN